MRPELEHHTLSPLGTERYNAIGEACSTLLNEIDKHCTANVREVAHARQRVIEACFWARRSLVLTQENIANGHHDPPPRSVHSTNFALLAVAALALAFAVSCRATIEPEPLITVDLHGTPVPHSSDGSSTASAHLTGDALIRELRARALRLPEDSPRRRELVLMQRGIVQARHECEVAPPAEVDHRQQRLNELVARANVALANVPE